MTDQPQRVAIVTGAAGGIGGAITARLAADGYRIIAVDRNPDVAGLGTVSPFRIDPLVRDVAADAAPDEIVSFALDRCGRIDALVNNAGIGRSKSMMETTDEELDRFLSVNLRSVFRLSRSVMPHLGEGSSVVHVASTFALVGTAYSAAYGATKTAIAGLTRQMAAEFGPRSVRVNAVAPGLIDTPMTANPAGKSAFYEKVLVAGTPHPRIGLPSDVAGPVSFLCSPDSIYVNGHVLAVDAGFTAVRYSTDS